MQAPAPVQDLDRYPEAILELDEHGVVVDANARAARLLGQPEGTLAGMALAVLGDGDFVDGTRRAIADGGPPFVATLTTADGRVPVEVRVGPAGTGALRTAMVLVRDLRPDHRASRALRQSHAALQAILHNEPECVKLLDADGRLVDMNPAGLRLIGAEDLATVHLVPVAELVVPEHRERFAAAVATVFRGEKVQTAFEIRSLDGTRRWMEQNAAPLWDPDDPTRVKHMLAVTRDVTRRRQRELEDLRKQRIEAIGELAGGIAHDLNNVLAPIALSLDELRRSVGPRHAGDLQTLQRGIRHAADMLRQLLTFARGVEGERVPVSPAAVVQDLGTLLDATLPKSIALRTRIGTDCMVLADATQLHQVLLNLCLNARDAMGEGGELRVSVEEITLEAPEGIGAEACAPGPYVALHVEDQGCGIPEAALGYIFDPFFSTKGPDAGTGLGLSSTLGIVRSHGGFMRVHSEVGVGTRFSVFLPAAPRQGQPAPPAPAAPTDRGRIGAGLRVLLVEDDDTVRRITARLLRATGFEVAEAEDGAQALTTWADRAQDLALLYTDLHMPYMDGIELTHRLRERAPALPVILATGRFDEAARRRMAPLGGVVALEKPFAPSELRDALVQVLAD